MAERTVSVAVTRQYDRTSALTSGEFTAGGMPLAVSVQPLERVFSGMGREQLWDVAEMSFSFYLSMCASMGPECPIVALPVFLSRMFRYGNIYVRADADSIHDAKDLEGRRIGVPEYGSTMSLWIRGILSDLHGVDWAGTRWLPAREPLVVDYPGGLVGAGVKGEREVPVFDQFSALANGDLDAVFGSLDRLIPPESVGVRRLFSDYYERDRDYYITTGIFPVMHVAVVSRSFLGAHGDAVGDLYNAFCVAKDRALARLAASGPLPVTLPFLGKYLEDQTALMGEDPWPYGVEQNLGTIEAALRYAFDQGLTSRRLDVADAFPQLW